MSETPETTIFDGLTVEDATLPESPPVVPNHKASRARRGLFGKADDGEPTVRAGRTRTAKPKKPAPRAKKGAFTQPLEQMYVGLGMVLMPFDNVCGQAIIAAAPECARTLDELAYQNEAVRRILASLTTSSAVGAVVIAHAPIIMAVMVHHVPAAQMAMGSLGANMAEQFANQQRESENGSE